jgi:transcriptional regulator with XRE-family HTH domain
MPSPRAYYADVPRNKTLRQVLADNLSAAMKAKKLSQPKVAAAAKSAGRKIDQTTVGRIARGEIPTTVDTLDALAAGVGFEPWQLLMEGFSPERPAAAAVRPSDEQELIDNYRNATGRWRGALLLMSRLHGDNEQDDAAGSMVTVLAKIAKDPASNERVKEALLTSRHGFPPGRPSVHEVREPEQAPDKPRKR